MPLTEQEREEIQPHLIAVLGDSPQERLATALGDRAAKLPQLAVTDPAAYATALLAGSTDEQLSLLLSIFGILFDSLRDRLEASVARAAAGATQSTAPAPAAGAENPFEHLLLGPVPLPEEKDLRKPMIDRHDLRRYLRDLASGRRRILVVDNTRAKSGKTWSLHLVKHLQEASAARPKAAQAPKEFRFFYYKLSDVPPPTDKLPSPGGMADDLVRKLGQQASDRPDRDNSTIDRWPANLASWVMSKAAASNRTWWMVLDGFRYSKDRWVTNLVLQLALQLEHGGQAFDVRLILLDHPSNLSLQLSEVCHEDTIENIGTLEVRSFLDAILASSSKTVLEETYAACERLLDGSEDQLERVQEVISGVLNA